MGCGKRVIGGERSEPDRDIWDRCAVELEALVQSVEVGQPVGVEIGLDGASSASQAVVGGEPPGEPGLYDA